MSKRQLQLRSLFACVALLAALEVAAASDASVDSHPGVFPAERFPSGPAGVILEGTAAGMDTPAVIGFDGKSNCFTLDGKMLYRNPVTWAEWLEILEAIQKDDRYGVSLSMDMKLITFGGLSERSRIAEALVRADKLLAGVCFGMPRLLGDVDLPGGFRPVTLEKRDGVIGCFNITNFTFAKTDGEYRRSKCEIQVFLLAVTKQRAADGGHLADPAATEKLEKEMDQTNIDHLKAHEAEYLKIPVLAKAAAVGEAASFARFLRESGFDLAVLQVQMSAKNPAGVIESPAAIAERKKAAVEKAPADSKTTSNALATPDAERETKDGKKPAPKAEPKAEAKKAAEDEAAKQQALEGLGK